jgi:predicted MPP superfamily phosphohydrolase
MKDWKCLKSYAKRNIIGSAGPFKVVSYTVNSEKIYSPLSIVFLSDIHSDAEKLSPLENIINNLNPDFIVFCGDAGTYLSDLEKSFVFLNKLHAKKAKIAVLGNWELKKKHLKKQSFWRKKYEDAGFILLTDDNFLSDNIIFDGIMPGTKNISCEFRKNNINGQFYKIRVAHIPDDTVRLKNHFDLALSGHTHAGQIRIPFIGAIKTSSRYWKDFEYGFYHNQTQKSYLIVSSGLGTSLLPFRFLCNPEIVLVKLQFAF